MCSHDSAGSRKEVTYRGGSSREENTVRRLPALGGRLRAGAELGAFPCGRGKAVVLRAWLPALRSRWKSTTRLCVWKGSAGAMGRTKNVRVCFPLPSSVLAQSLVREFGATRAASEQAHSDGSVRRSQAFFILAETVEGVSWQIWGERWWWGSCWGQWFLEGKRSSDSNPYSRS